MFGCYFRGKSASAIDLALRLRVGFWDGLERLLYVSCFFV